MFKVVKPYLFSFDVEWIPDPMTGELLHGVEHNPPYSLHDAMRSMWLDAGATEEQPQPFLKTSLCRIVSIAGIFREEREGEVKLSLISLPDDVKDEEKTKESALLAQFLKAVGRRRPQLVGFNSANSDVPIIVQRAIVNGLPSFGMADRPDKPWEGTDYFAQSSDDHVDLAPIVGRWGMTPKLHEIANICGIPGKMGISGDSVAEMWLLGNLKGIVDYNEFDAFTTHLLWARIAHFGGHLSSEAYEQEQELTEQLLIHEIAGGRKHLQPYLAEWQRLRKRVAER